MKTTRTELLSQHLLREAGKFIRYPHRTGKPFDSELGRSVDETAARAQQNLARKAEDRPVFSSPDNAELSPATLDDRFCREQLRTIPRMVEVTLRLKRLGSPSKPLSRETEFYLREAAKCLLFGLDAASAALARGALERHLWKLWCDSVVSKRSAIRPRWDLEKLIDNVLGRHRPELLEPAHQVRKTANATLHRRVITPEEAMKCYEAARAVLFESN